MIYLFSPSIRQIVGLKHPKGGKAKNIKKHVEIYGWSLWSTYPSHSAERSVSDTPKKQCMIYFFCPPKGHVDHRLPLWMVAVYDLLGPFSGPFLLFCFWGLVVVVLWLLFLFFCCFFVVLVVFAVYVVVVVLLFVLLFVMLLLLSCCFCCCCCLCCCCLVVVLLLSCCCLVVVCCCLHICAGTPKEIYSKALVL